MKFKAKAVLSLIFYVVFFVFIPLLLLNFIPSEMLNSFNSFSKINIQSFILVIIVTGLILGILSFIKNSTEKNNAIHLISSILIILIGFYLTLFFLGLGDVFSFGLAKQTIQINKQTVFLTINFTFFVLLFAVIVLLKLIKEFLEFYFSRKSSLNSSSISNELNVRLKENNY